MPEKTIEARLGELRGASRDFWLFKWQSWIRERMRPGIEPERVLGYPIRTLSDVERVLRAYCGPLTESQCYNNLSSVIESGVRKILAAEYGPPVQFEFEMEQELIDQANAILDMKYPVTDPVTASRIIAFYKAGETIPLLLEVEKMLKRDYHLSDEEIREIFKKFKPKIGISPPIGPRPVPKEYPPKAPPQYLPETVRKVLAETGAHYMCLLRKANEKGVSLKDEKKLRELAVECFNEGKLAPTKKYFLRLCILPLRPPAKPS